MNRLVSKSSGLLTAIFLGGLALFEVPTQATTLQIQASAQKALSATRVKQLHYGDLLNNSRIRSDLEVELRHLNSDKKVLRTDEEPWRFGSVVPAGFQFTANKTSLDKIIKASSASGFGRTGKMGVFQDGRLVGYRTVELFFFEVAPTRNVGKPYTAAIMVARDIDTGSLIFVHSLIREFESNDPLNIHEFAVRDGQVVRLSNKKGETTILGSYGVSSGISKTSADYIAKRTLPNAQKATGVYKQVQQLIVTDGQANQNEAITSTITLSNAERETSWWKQFRTQLLDALKEAGKKILKSLLDSAKEILKSIGGALLDSLKNLVSDLLKGFLSWLGL